MARPDSKWYKLDSAGILYSALQKEEYSAIYRFSAQMEREVDPAALQRAIDRCMPRFPSFAVRIRKGLFWYYLEPNHASGPFLKEDVSDPCQPVASARTTAGSCAFYITVSAISVEVFHALSDGGGAIVFFRTLLAEYLRQTGVDVPAGNGVLDLNEPPREEELEDAYARYAIQQIKDKKYPESLLQYTGNILLVGINYDKKSKAHECVIEEYKR